MAVALSSAVMRNRLGWQNRSPSPLTCRSASSGRPAHAGGNGSLLRLVRLSVTHWALYQPRWLGYTTNSASVLYSAFFHGM